MPHQHHFLSRLDRIAAPQVELALQLYRDHELVHFLLARVRLPEGAERVALSLDDPERGPFLIVTRDGRFVTCLGEGMTPGDLPIVTRGQLDGVAAKHGDVRERVEMCRRLSGRAGGTGRLLVRLFEAADELSREEFVGISSLQPLLEREMIEMLVRIATDLGESLPKAAAILRRTDRPKGAHLALLRAHYQSVWLAAHLTVLITMEGRELLSVAGPGMLRPAKMFFSSMTFTHAIVGPATRGLWGVAKVGKLLLPNYKEGYTGAAGALKLAEAALGLTVLGLRHSKLRAEVRKALAVVPASFAEGGSNDALREFATFITAMSSIPFDQPEGCKDLQRQQGAKLVVQRTSSLPQGSPFRFEREDDVPQAIAMAQAVTWEIDFLSDLTRLHYLFLFAPWLAEVEAEDLYLPQDFLAAVRRPWTPERAIRLVKPFVDHGRAVAAEREVGPSRNGPCPCGSGKKYKRCCMSAEADGA